MNNDQGAVMGNAENIQNELIKKFPYLEGKVRIQRERRIYADVPLDKFREMFDYAVDKMGFIIMPAITGFDEGDYLGFMYHTAKENGIILNIKTTAPKSKPVIDTVTDRFPAADLYERELEDLLGAKVNGLKPGRRYPLPEDWPADQHPLRKDWKPEVK